MKNVVLENFAKSIRKHLCQSLFFNKVAGLWPVITWKHKMYSKVTTKNSKLQQKKCSAIAIIYDFHNFTEQNLMNSCFFSIDFNLYSCVGYMGQSVPE